VTLPKFASTLRTALSRSANAVWTTTTITRRANDRLLPSGAQLALAQELGRPVVVHTREAEDDTLSMVRDAAASGVRGVLHCYTGSVGLAEVALDGGWYVSFSGIVTFKKWTDEALLRVVPADRLLVESDSPYLAPVPHRGKRNEPAWVSFTVARLAAVRGVETAALGASTAENARQLFGLA
jgi:TatD DNase family protein